MRWGVCVNESLHDEVIDRLLAADLDTVVVALVDAACQGDGALAEVMENLGAASRPAAVTEPGAAERPDPPGAYLEQIEVQGFRGIGEKARIELTPGPGLTLVVGRNGSGKSSFADGLETLLTGESGRWSGRRSKLWREGWRNLHYEGPTEVAARFVVEGYVEEAGGTTAAMAGLPSTREIGELKARIGSLEQALRDLTTQLQAANVLPEAKAPEAETDAESSDRLAAE